jgi:predicted nuclease of restriction endonuclease-like (RecB) superfamily
MSIPSSRLIEAPTGYADWLADLKSRIHAAQQRASLAVNRELVLLYWQIGDEILARQATEGWGAKVVERLAHDLRTAFPDMKGMSPRNLKYMRSFAQAWPDAEFVQAVLAQLPWYHQLVLLDKLDTTESRRWYAAKAMAGRATSWSCRSKPEPWSAAAPRRPTSHPACPSRNRTWRTNH